MNTTEIGSTVFARELVRAGIDIAFVFQGGAIASAIDAVSREGIRIVPFDHELDAAYAAEGFARSSGRPACVLTTSGPGATNLISGLCGSWFDGVPVLFVTGQVRARERTDFDWNLQSGFQEVDIVSMVSRVPKYAKRVYDSRQVAVATTAAIRAMLQPRRGPALLDFTMNAQMDSTSDMRVELPVMLRRDTTVNVKALDAFFKALVGSHRPLLVLGGGFQWEERDRVRIALEKLGVPCVATYGGVNVLPLRHPLHRGLIGPFGHQSANQAFVEASDLFIIGARVPTRALPPMQPECAERVRQRSTWVLTTDPEEFATHPLAPDFVAQAEVESLFDRIEEGFRWSGSDEWRHSASDLMLPKHFFSADFDSTMYAPRDLVEALDCSLAPNTRIFVDVGQNAVALALGLSRDGGQLLFSSWANSPMGYSLAAALGASLDASSPPTVCVIGDGGFRTALSSLPNLSVCSGRLKLIIWDNGGYATIVDHLHRMLGGRRTAVDANSGLPPFPIKPVLEAINLSVTVAEGDLNECMKEFLSPSGTDVLLVSVDARYRLFPNPPLD